MSMNREMIPSVNEKENHSKKYQIVSDVQEFNCPITLQSIRHPVVTIDEYANAALFEAKALHQYLVEQHRANSPLTRGRIVAVGYAHFLSPFLAKQHPNLFPDYNKGQMVVEANRAMERKNIEIYKKRIVALQPPSTQLVNQSHLVLRLDQEQKSNYYRINKNVYFSTAVMVALLCVVCRPNALDERPTNLFIQALAFFTLFSTVLVASNFFEKQKMGKYIGRLFSRTPTLPEQQMVSRESHQRHLPNMTRS